MHMDNIEDILRVLAEDDETDGDADCGQQEGSSDGGLFSGLDPETLIKIMALSDSLKESDDNERFLYALKPLLHEENRPKVDSAARILKLLRILPILRESGLMGKLL